MGYGGRGWGCWVHTVWGVCEGERSRADPTLPPHHPFALNHPQKEEERKKKEAEAKKAEAAANKKAGAWGGLPGGKR